MTNIDDLDLENSTPSVLFDCGWRSQIELSKVSDESTQEYDRKRLKIIQVLEKCEHLLDEIHLFSDNESLEEISTNELRYFLNYALLGWLFSKINSPVASKRLPSLEQAKTCIIKYLILTKNYGFHNLNLDKFKNNLEKSKDDLANHLTTQAGRQAAFDQNLLSQAYDRNEKIKRYREQKEIEQKLDNFLLCLAKPHLDEEQKREIYLTFIKYWLNKSIDDLKVINDEINILESIKDDNDARKPNGAVGNHRVHSHQHPAAAAASKPYIITRDAIQAQVFGAGYPSVPVYSIEEFYDQLSDKGMMPKSNEEHKKPVQIGGGVTESQKAKEKEQKDLLEDKDDEEELRKQREWDEFKDDNKRGSGNRYNRS